MISTGREYDRFVIALVVVSVFALAIYVLQCNKKNTTDMKSQESSLTDRINKLTKQVDETSNTMKQYLSTPTKKEEKPVEKKLPNPVSSSFLG
jgi:S-adenosylmethionine:diacylglycerol 3-amino-3-carboxypropyl transferase